MTTTPVPAGRASNAIGSVTSPLARLAQPALFSSLGLLLVALADTAARNGDAWAPVPFWLGLLTIVLPVAVRLLRTDAGRLERVSLVVLAGMALYLVKVLHSPSGFTFFDEFHHWATLADILATNHLFTHNNILPASPYYPGLEVATAPLVAFGLGPWEAGVVVVGAARLLMGTVLFLFFERIAGSARVAGLAALVYMANPSFLLFDAQYAYESLALPLAVFVLWSVARREDAGRRASVALTVALLLALVAVVTTHHITSYALSAFLVVWAALSWVVRRSSGSPGVTGPALLSLTATIGWTLYVATVTVGYLAPALDQAVAQVADLIVGEASGRELFRAASGVPAPAWEQVAGYASVAVVLVALPFGVWAAWRAQALEPGSVALSLAALLYPASLVARLTQSGAELAARSVEFIFLGAGFVVAHLCVALTEASARREIRALAARLLTAGAAVLFVGGAVVGVPFWARMPGPYLVSADPRSIEPQGIAAARWTVGRLGPDARMTTDRTNRVLMKTYGRQHPISAVGDRTDVKGAYFATALGPGEERVLRDARVRYVVADERLTTSLPTVGVYVERGEIREGPHLVPLARAALAKWDDAAGVDRIFDSGDIRIYDVGRLSGAP